MKLEIAPTRLPRKYSLPPVRKGEGELQADFLTKGSQEKNLPHSPLSQITNSGAEMHIEL